MSIETSKTEQREKKRRKTSGQNIQSCWKIRKCNIIVMGIAEGEDRKGQKKYLK